jgi:hypothetical protein
VVVRKVVYKIKKKKKKKISCGVKKKKKCLRLKKKRKLRKEKEFFLTIYCSPLTNLHPFPPLDLSVEVNLITVSLSLFLSSIHPFLSLTPSFFTSLPALLPTLTSTRHGVPPRTHHTANVTLLPLSLILLTLPGASLTAAP